MIFFGSTYFMRLGQKSFYFVVFLVEKMTTKENFQINRSKELHISTIWFLVFYFNVCRTCKRHRISNFVCKLCVAWSTRIFQSLSFLQNTSVDSICLQFSNKFVNPPCAIIPVIKALKWEVGSNGWCYRVSHDFLNWLWGIEGPIFFLIYGA